jgi:hypothetical protein
MKFIYIKILLLFLVVFSITWKAHAQETLNVNINKKQFNYGDTIVLEHDFKYENKLSSTSTLNLWIEDIDNHTIWKYRYPLLNGSLSHSLIVGQDLLPGKYAFNFMIQKYIFGFYGHVVNYNINKSKGLNFMMLGKKNGVYMDIITPNNDGDFITPRMIFEDTSRFIFTSIGDRDRNLYIEAITPLDSAIHSSISQTILINIGDTTTKNNKYKFEQATFGGNFTLDQATVKTVKMKQVEKFDREYSTSMFKSPFAQIFDGIESDQIAKSFDLIKFLQFRIAGLKVEQVNPDYGDEYILTLREKFPVDLYIDEVKIENASQLYINPADVAMIKVFGPLQGGPTTSMTADPHASIAIYSKRGEYQDTERKYNFLVKGYTPSIIIWNK